MGKKGLRTVSFTFCSRLEDFLIFSLSNLQAYQELGLLLVLVAVAILTYASLVYFAEKENNDGKSCNI
jgi:hypothetical protein